jgi:hypothetical protein
MNFFKKITRERERERDRETERERERERANHIDRNLIPQPKTWAIKGEKKIPTKKQQIKDS